MSYYFADLVPSPEGGWEPRMPDNLGFLLLAEPGHEAAWGIYDVSLIEDEPSAPGFHRVSDDLSTLLTSAEGYPPAMALARNEVDKKWNDLRPTRQEFSTSLAESLRQHLQAQPHVNYRLAEGVKEELGYLSKGEFCWVLQYSPALEKVRWVSSDYDVYVNAASDFDLSQEQLDMLSK